MRLLCCIRASCFSFNDPCVFQFYMREGHFPRDSHVSCVICLFDARSNNRVLCHVCVLYASRAFTTRFACFICDLFVWYEIHLLCTRLLLFVHEPCVSNTNRMLIYNAIKVFNNSLRLLDNCGTLLGVRMTFAWLAHTIWSRFTYLLQTCAFQKFDGMLRVIKAAHEFLIHVITFHVSMHSIFWKFWGVTTRPGWIVFR